MEDLTSRQWNHLIRCANDGDTPEQLADSLSDEELKIYRNMYEKLMELRKTNPRAAYWPVETDW